MTIGRHGLHRAAPNQTFVTSTIRTIFADAATIGAEDGCSPAGMVKPCEALETLAAGETPFADGLGTTQRLPPLVRKSVFKVLADDAGMDRLPGSRIAYIGC